MATLRDIKNRIKGVRSTEQITKAMKMVAAAKLRRAQDAIINARPYARKISELLSHLVTDYDILNNPFVQERDVKNIAIVSITADRGLCGAFNTNIIKEVNKFISEQEGNVNNAHLFCIGRKGFDFFSKRDYSVQGNYIGIFQHLKYEDARKISDELISQYLAGKYDKIYIVYNEFKSIIQQKITVEQFLPIPVIKASKEHKEAMPDYIFEPNQESIFNYLLPKHLKAQLWRTLLESNAAELGARMTAMDNATTNAQELIRTLQINYNKERQSAITTEILEIVSGANALKSN
ncbi:MAG: ATP synthase F1 subunit gamma [Bacteroidota bacterium]|nr:ATP synthase F1 subunit gamma [Bacteroidota bacterium]